METIAVLVSHELPDKKGVGFIICVSRSTWSHTFELISLNRPTHLKNLHFVCTALCHEFIAVLTKNVIAHEITEKNIKFDTVLSFML